MDPGYKAPVTAVVWVQSPAQELPHAMGVPPPPKKPHVIKKWALERERHFSKEEMQLANRPMKICLVSLIIRKMQIETAKRYHLTPVRIAIIKNPTKTNVSEDVEKRGTLIHCCWGYKFVQTLGKQYGGFSRN